MSTLNHGPLPLANSSVWIHNSDQPDTLQYLNDLLELVLSHIKIIMFGSDFLDLEAS